MTKVIYFLAKIWARIRPLALYSDSCPECHGAGGRTWHDYGDYWNPPEHDYDPCEACVYCDTCPSCSKKLSKDDSEMVFADEKPCPFCGWTVRAGYELEAERGFEDLDDYDPWEVHP